MNLLKKDLILFPTSVEDASFFILPDVGSMIADLEKSGLNEREKLKKKDELLQDYSVKSESVHTMTQLLKGMDPF